MKSLIRYFVPLVVFGVGSLSTMADSLTIVTNVEWQPFSAQVRRLIEAREISGWLLSPQDFEALTKALAQSESKPGGEIGQRILDSYCLFQVHINPESRVKVARGPVRAELVEQGWRQFLVKVVNDAG